MLYEFKCSEHGLFEVKQSIYEEHTAKCPKCNTEAKRVFCIPRHYYDNPKPLFHKDGSYEEI